MKVERLGGNPIITPHMDGRMGSNVNGPSLIRVPDWVENPLGRYYLYFAHHRGTYIRLAYADRLEGPWSIHGPGTLQLEDSHFGEEISLLSVGVDDDALGWAGYARRIPTLHIASPDVHADGGRQEIRLYFHGCCSTQGAPEQYTRVALSKDGIRFSTEPEALGGPYWRVFQWQGCYYALSRSGQFSRSPDGLRRFEEGPCGSFPESMRHLAVTLHGDVLFVFYSRAGDRPERIKSCRLELTPNWWDWRASELETVLEPEMEYEGSDLPFQPSAGGLTMERVRQLRDPCVFQEGEDTYLLYSVAGESGIAVARLVDL
jgi:hypothetical protein